MKIPNEVKDILLEPLCPSKSHISYRSHVLGKNYSRQSDLWQNITHNRVILELHGTLVEELVVKHTTSSMLEKFKIRDSVEALLKEHSLFIEGQAHLACLYMPTLSVHLVSFGISERVHKLHLVSFFLLENILFDSISQHTTVVIFVN